MIDWLLENQQAATLLFTGVVALSTLIYAILTAFLVSETMRMRRSQTDPKLAAYFQPTDEFVNFGYLYIKNIGLGPAYDITFELRSEGNESGAQYLISDFTRTKFLERGVKFLGPGQTLQSGFTNFSEHLDQKIEAAIRVTLRYRSATRRIQHDEYRIDFSELEGFGKLGKPHLYAIAQNIEKIQKDFHHFISGFKKLQVDMYDRDDREQARKDMEDERIRRKKVQDESNEN